MKAKKAPRIQTLSEEVQEQQQDLMEKHKADILSDPLATRADFQVWLLDNQQNLEEYLGQQDM